MIPNTGYNLFQTNQTNDLNRCSGIDGVNGVKMVNTLPNSRTPFFDKDEDVVYIVTTDSDNRKTGILKAKLEAFEIVPLEAAFQQPTDILTKNDLETFRKELLEDVRNIVQSTNTNDNRSGKSNNSNGKPN